MFPPARGRHGLGYHRDHAGPRFGVTPLTLAGVGYGNHLLALRRYQYAEHTQVLKVAEPSVTASVTLKPLGRGRLRVVSQPEGAEVFLNGVPRGKTPLALGDLLPGKYQMRLEAEDCSPYQGTLEVQAGQQTAVEQKLESKSEAYLLDAIAQDPTRVVNYYDLAHHYARVQEFDKAFAMFAQGFDACVSPNVRTGEQRRLYDELERVWDGQYQFADESVRQSLRPRILDALSKAIQRQPRNVLNYWSLGEFYEKDKDYARSSALYAQGIAAMKGKRAKDYLEHLLAQACYQQGVALEKEKKHDEALAIYEALVAAHPKAYYSGLVLSSRLPAIWQNHRKDYVRAIEAKQRYIALHPTRDQSASLQMDIANTYRSHVKDYPRALEAYRTFLSRYPRSESCPTAQIAIASILSQYVKDVPAAIQEYEKYLKEYPEDDSVPTVLRALSELYRTLSLKPETAAGAKEKSEEYRKRLLTEFAGSQEAWQADPDPEARKRRREVWQAYQQASALATKEPEKGIAGLEEVVRKYPRFLYARYAQSQIVQTYTNHLKDNEKANQARQKYLELFPDSDQCPNMLYQIGYNKAFVMKRYEEGVADLRRLIKTYPRSSLCPTAQYYIASIYSFSYGHYDREKNIAENRRLIHDYPGYDGVDGAQMNIALNYYYQTQVGDKEKAQREFLKLIENYPHGAYAQQSEYYLDLLDAGMQLEENAIK